MIHLSSLFPLLSEIGSTRHHLFKCSFQGSGEKKILKLTLGFLNSSCYILSPCWSVNPPPCVPNYLPNPATSIFSVKTHSNLKSALGIGMWNKNSLADIFEMRTASCLYSPALRIYRQAVKTAHPPSKKWDPGWLPSHLNKRGTVQPPCNHAGVKVGSFYMLT